MNKYEELARKIKAIADRGIEGEKVNAEKQLQKLLAKHGLSIGDIEGEKTGYHYFRVDKEHYQIFIQVVASVVGQEFQILIDRRRKGYKALETTLSIFLEIESKFQFYKRCYDREKLIFTKAFINRHDLFSKDSEPKSLSTMSAKELSEARRILQMADNIELSLFRKQLARGQS